MAIAWQGGGAQNFANAGSSTYTMSFTAAGTNRFIAVLAATDRTTMAINSATYAGNAMTAFAATLSNAQGETNVRGFYIAGDASIPTGAQNIVVTFGAATSNNPVFVVGNWDGVDGTAPVSGAAMTDCSSGGNTTTISATVSSATGDVVAGLVQQGYARSENPTFSAGTDTTSRLHTDYTTGVIRSVTVFDEPGGASVTVGGTQSPTSRAQMVTFSIKAASAGGNIIAVPAGALTLTGNAPTVTSTANQTIEVPAGTLALTGYAPTVTATAQQTIEVPAGTLALTGYAPTVTATAHQTIEVPAGTLALTGYAPSVTVAANQTIQVPAGTLALTGHAPTVTATANQTIEVPAGTLALTGYAPIVLAVDPQTVLVPLGTMTLTAYAPTVTSVTAAVFADDPRNKPRVGTGTLAPRDVRVGGSTLAGGNRRVGPTSLD